jgi:hypothetical protein
MSASGDNMLNVLMIVLSLNLIMFFVGFGMADVGGTNPFIDEENILTQFNNGTAGSYDVPTDVGGTLPSGVATTISPDTGLSITDIFVSTKTWLVDVTGLGFVLGVLSGPKIILTFMGLPEALAWAITALWYALSLFVVITFIWGR